MEDHNSDTLHKYFALVWTATFFCLYRISRMKSFVDAAYDKAVVQAFVSIICTMVWWVDTHAPYETDRRIKQL